MGRHNWLIGAAAVVTLLTAAERRQYQFAVEYFTFTCGQRLVDVQRRGAFGGEPTP